MGAIPMLRAAARSAGMRGRLIEAHRLLRADPGAGPKLIAARKAGDPRAEMVVRIATEIAAWPHILPDATTSALYRKIALRCGCSDATAISCVWFIVRVPGGKDANA